MRVVVTKVASVTGSGGAETCPDPTVCRGPLDVKGGNPDVVRGTEGVKMGVGGTEVENPSGTTRVSRGSRVR